MSQEEVIESLNFIEQIIEEDIKSDKHGGAIQTRFPPHPNGYLHIGHAKSIVLNFGLAEKYKGKCNLRFDDTNPEKESVEYIEAIKKDIAWLGYNWSNELYASDYFDKLFEWAKKLITLDKAYVDDQSAEEISTGRGVPSQPGTASPHRNRSVEENLKLFEEMRDGKYQNGEKGATRQNRYDLTEYAFA